MSSAPAVETDIAAPRWGIRFERPTLAHGGLPLLILPVPAQLIVPVHQHIGVPAIPIVAVGEHVLKSQPLATVADGVTGAAVHAPTSGRITAIGQHAIPGRGTGLCIFIEADGDDRPWPGHRAVAAPLDLPAAELRAAIAAAGIVGLGGATFPTAFKLNRENGINLLILNGVECEPRINCDDALMRVRAAEILLGAQLLLRVLDAPACLVAVKAGAEPALAALRAALDALGDARIRLVRVPAVYPAGGEAQLVQLLTGMEIPAGRLPADIGVICHNVATAAAVARFLTHGEALISRIVTVTGSGVARPLNIEARLGTPVSELIRAAGGYTGTAMQLAMGGPMMGVPLPTDELPVTKACNCIYVEPQTAVSKAPEQPCIRCGECATVCPVALTPQLLLQAHRTSDFERLQQLGLDACIECGCCDYVCPSHIRLTATFVAAKYAHQDLMLEQQRAKVAETRYRAREERLDRQAQARQQELDAQTEPLNATATDSQAALRALLDRVAQKSRDGEP